MAVSSAPTLLLVGGLSLPSTVRLVAPPSPVLWTDDPITTDTPIKAVHVNELRRAVDLRRRECGLPSFDWTDDPVIRGYSLIQAVHFLELRQAIQDIWGAAG